MAFVRKVPAANGRLLSRFIVDVEFLMADFKLRSRNRSCAVSGTELKGGDVYYSALMEEGDDVVRQDILADHWNDPPENCIGWWKAEIPIVDSTKVYWAPRSVIFDYFVDLQSKPDKAIVLYLLTLLMIRKRYLKLEEIQTERVRMMIAPVSDGLEEEIEQLEALESELDDDDDDDSEIDEIEDVGESEEVEGQSAHDDEVFEFVDPDAEVTWADEPAGDSEDQSDGESDFESETERDVESGAESEDEVKMQADENLNEEPAEPLFEEYDQEFMVVSNTRGKDEYRVAVCHPHPDELNKLQDQLCELLFSNEPPQVDLDVDEN